MVSSDSFGSAIEIEGLVPRLTACCQRCRSGPQLPPRHPATPRRSDKYLRTGLTRETDQSNVQTVDYWLIRSFSNLNY